MASFLIEKEARAYPRACPQKEGLIKIKKKNTVGIIYADNYMGQIQGYVFLCDLREYPSPCHLAHKSGRWRAKGLLTD